MFLFILEDLTQTQANTFKHKEIQIIQYILPTCTILAD